MHRGIGGDVDEAKRSHLSQLIVDVHESQLGRSLGVRCRDRPRPTALGHHPCKGGRSRLPVELPLLVEDMEPGNLRRRRRRQFDIWIQAVLDEAGVAQVLVRLARVALRHRRAHVRASVHDAQTVRTSRAPRTAANIRRRTTVATSTCKWWW